MYKKIGFLLLLIMVSILPVFASIDTVKVKSEIKDVTVFFNGAQVSREANVTLKKGKIFLSFEQLPHELNPQSIQVEALKGTKILSVKHEFVYPSANKSTEEIALQEKIDNIELKIKEILNKIEVTAIEENLLIDNSKFQSNNQTSSIAQVKEAADYYRLRLNEIRQSRLLLQKEKENQLKIKKELFVQMNILTSAESKTYSRVIVAIEAEKEITGKLFLKYFINSAGWQPSYDFRVDDINQPLSIVYNASIYQSSGEDWNVVNLKLSNTNPSLKGEKPELSTWYLGRTDPNIKIETSTAKSVLSGHVFDATTKDPVPFANVSVSQNNKFINGGSTDIDGRFSINPIPAGKFDVKVTFIGYKSNEIKDFLIKANTNFLDISLEPATTQLEEVSVSAYEVPLMDKNETSPELVKMAGRSAYSSAITVGGVYKADENTSGYEVYKAKSTENYTYAPRITTDYISNSLKKSVANLEYTIDIPYTILNDGKDNLVKIKETKLEVNYVYYAVPKIDADAFLVAELINWSDLNLLSGKSSIYYQGTFVGESFLDIATASDTLNLSLGRDKNILVQREGNKSVNDKRVFGNNVKENVGWDIHVKNNKSVPIRIIIEDQIPISERKSFEIEEMNYGAAIFNANTGKLSWDIKVEPNEKKTVNFKYLAKYPLYTY